MTYADYFEGQVAKLLMDEYPCAQVATGSGLGAVLQFKRAQRLLGADEGDLSTLLGAVGARYVIELMVTDDGSGPVRLNATMKNSATSQPLEESSSVTSDGDAALDAIEALAKQFVDSLTSLAPFSKSKCNPTNPWAGTITYHLKQSPPADVNVRNAISGNGKGTVTQTMTHNVDDQVSIRIGWTGSPQATIIMKESSNTEEKAIVQMDCGRPTIVSNAPDLRSGGWDHVELMEETAGDDVAATVSVTIANGRYTIKLNVPAIQGTVKRTLHNHNDGGCGKPNDDNPEPKNYNWDNAMVILPVIDQPLYKPNVLNDSQDDGNGGKATWNLTRTPMKQ